MNISKTNLDGVILIDPLIYPDERGYFFESFNLNKFSAALGIDVDFVQDNQSFSHKNVLRGLHYQAQPYGQGKLVRVIKGSVYDVAVDVRRSSRTFGHWVSAELSDSNHKQLWIPAGFAHGFLVLSDDAIVSYKTTSYYNHSAERCIRWDDPTVDIKWPAISRPLLSAKDANGSLLECAELYD